MPTLPFTVDAKLLRELGERLVGKPFIALGELIKNSYDADATLVEITFLEKDEGTININDNGCGMTFEEFKNYWMRIGSTHKEEWKSSKEFGRPLTGQKGVGRLAVQLLANEMELTTVSEKKENKLLRAFVRWEEAVKAGDLIKAKVHYETESGKFKKGTTVKLMDLRQEWGETEFKNLAKELWVLTAPFRGFESKKGPFQVELKTYDKEVEEKFEAQMKAVLKAYEAKIYGKNDGGMVYTSIIYPYGDQINFQYNLSELPGIRLPPDKELMNGEFEIRIYRLEGRQRYGILLEDLRNYMHEFAGVHIYDSGFHLPYYGGKESDWLGILSEQSRRISTSDLLPEDLQVSEGLTRLPNLDRILGVVHINTAKEPGLEIAITRDRLVETETYQALKNMVRYALHWYAMEDKRRLDKFKHSMRAILERPEKMERIEEILERYKPKIPEKTFENLKEDIDITIEKVDKIEDKTREQVSLLGAFATAGISSLAYRHEINKQIVAIDNIVEDIEKLASENVQLSNELNRIGDELNSWARRARGIQSLFDYYADADNLTVRRRMNAEAIIDEVIKQVEGLGRDVKITNNVSSELLLPEASFVEWGAIFQNVLINAFNAMADSKVKMIEIKDISTDDRKKIIIQDTGCGVDLEKADELFMPFVRKMDIPPEKKVLGYGGSGIGLTIVRIISQRIGCRVSFVEPDKGYKTAFSLNWRE